MSASNNPTSVSATIGNRLRFSRGRGGTGLVKALLMPSLLAAFAIYLLVGIVTMKVPAGAAFPGPQFFPGIIAAGLALFAVLLAVADVRRWAAPESAPAAEGDGAGHPADAERSVSVDWRSLAWVAGSFAAFALLLDVLGWIIAAALLFWGIARGLGQRRLLAPLVIGLTISSLAYIAFDMGLGLSLPSGILGWGF